MKIYKLSSLTTLFLSLVIIGLVVFLPIVLIETLWNSTIGKTYTDIAINFWQALILWLIVLVALNIIGLFKFEFAVEAIDALDKESIKEKINSLKSLQNKTDEKKELEVKEIKDKESNL